MVDVRKGLSLVRLHPELFPWELRCRIMQAGLLVMLSPGILLVLKVETPSWLDTALIALTLVGFIAWFGGLISLAMYEKRFKASAAAHRDVANRYELAGDVERSRAESQEADFLGRSYASRIRFI